MWQRYKYFFKGVKNRIISSASNSSSNKKELIYDSTEAFNYSEVDSGISIIGFTNYDYVEYDKIIVPSEIDGKKLLESVMIRKIIMFLELSLETVKL